MNMNLIATPYLKGRLLGVGKLPKHRFVYRIVADVIPDETESVYGAVYDIDDEIEKELDYREQYPVYYLKKNVDVILEETGKKVNCMVYYMKEEFVRQVSPPPNYERTVVYGARTLKLPDWYIKSFLIDNS